MKNMVSVAALAAMLSGAVVPVSAFAQDSNYYRHHHHRTYRGQDRNYRQRCSGGNGAVGTVAGAGGGALIGNALGGGVLGTVAGGVGGGLLGRTLDKNNTRAKNQRNGTC